MHTKTLKHTNFSAFAHKTSKAIGSYGAFILAAVFVLGWLIIGSVLKYSPEWELVFVFVTGSVTLLMIILLQHSQNHATKALHLKLDELIRATKKARNSLVELEQLPEAQLDELKDEFQTIRDVAVRQEELRAEEPLEAEAGKVREPAL